MRYAVALNVEGNCTYFVTKDVSLARSLWTCDMLDYPHVCFDKACEVQKLKVNRLLVWPSSGTSKFWCCGLQLKSSTQALAILALQKMCITLKCRHDSMWRKLMWNTQMETELMRARTRANENAKWCSSRFSISAVQLFQEAATDLLAFSRQKGSAFFFAWDVSVFS